jgi:hypothetical protein
MNSPLTGAVAEWYLKERFLLKLGFQPHFRSKWHSFSVISNEFRRNERPDFIGIQSATPSTDELVTHMLNYIVISQKIFIFCLYVF